ncbi:hypothetical protein F4777DRAFT_587821 [Nemania sp. FL0916]|nr:hypothetical protein F4777DRAFT_587821 [Nemania sp. FL0916]
MTAHFPSIQSFYSREVPSDGIGDLFSPTEAGDGFTSSEVEALVNPLSREFRPSRHYDACPIADIQTGPHDYIITGRMVNFSMSGGPHRLSANASGYYFLVISDGTAAIAIKLYCNESEYRPLLGQRITIGHIPYCSIATTIHPGRNGATHIEFHVDEPGSDDDKLLRCPLEVNTEEYDYLSGLMTLKSFLASGYDLGEGKILVCVRSVGPRRTIHPRKREGTLDLVEVGVYDDTAHCVLKLWEDKIPSAKSWIPNRTILLISQPWCQVNHHSSRQNENSLDVGIGYSSMVDVDPDFPEAMWLRTKIQDLAKKERVLVPFPTNIWDVELAMHGPNRFLYTLAELEDQVRNDNPPGNFTGKLSVIVKELNLMDHWRKSTTCCTECCGIPLYAKNPIATCKNCDIRQDLSLNPRVIGSFLDESGMIAGNKLIWNDEAWTQFFFGAAYEEYATARAQESAAEQSWRKITAFDANSLRDLEAQLLYSRATLTFGWSVELGRLCILGVEW